MDTNRFTKNKEKGIPYRNSKNKKATEIIEQNKLIT